MVLHCTPIIYHLAVNPPTPQQLTTAAIAGPLARVVGVFEIPPKFSFKDVYIYIYIYIYIYGCMYKYIHVYVYESLCVLCHMR